MLTLHQGIEETDTDRYYRYIKSLKKLTLIVTISSFLCVITAFLISNYFVKYDNFMLYVYIIYLREVGGSLC